MYKNMILSADLSKHVGEVVEIRGWLHTVRVVSANLAFLIMRDKCWLAQVVFEDADEIKKLEGCLLGTVLSAKGTVAEMQKGKFRFELQRASVNIIRKVVYPSPIDISKDEIHADGETLLENKVVALRHPRQFSSSQPLWKKTWENSSMRMGLLRSIRQRLSASLQKEEQKYLR